VRDATEAWWRLRFAEESVRKLDALHADAVAWADYREEAESTHVADGIG
jgi:hypothetical protein